MYLAAHPENVKKREPYHAAYRVKHREKHRAGHLRYYAEHRDEMLEYRRQYREENRDKIRAWNNKRKAMLRNVSEITFTAEEWRAMRAAYGERCAYCGTKPDVLTMDHIVPLARGGTHTADNIVPACGPCNMHKKIGPAPTFVIRPNLREPATD